jgi:hypothetical protein
MSDFNIDDVLSQFGSKPAAASKSKDFDVDAILKEFDTSTPTAEAKPTERIYVSPPKPPISGATKEESDAINYGEAKKSLPVEAPLLTSEGAYEHNKAGREMVSSGIEDLQTGHPYKGIGKVALGSFGVAASPVSGIIDDLIVKPGNKIGPDFGDKAGLVASSAIPVVPGAGAALKALPKTKALSTLVENIGQENLPAVVQAMRNNPRLGPADLSPRVLQDTQHLFANDGPQIDYLAKTSAARMGGAKDAVETAYDAATGKPVNALEKVKALQQEAKDVGSQQINPAITGSKPVDVTPVLEHIDAITKPGVNKVITSESTLPSTEINSQLKQVRAMLANAKEQRTDPQALHHFQSILRQEADTLLNSADGSSRRMGKALMNVRDELVNVIDSASGGKYKPALSNYRDAKQIDDAFHHGYDGIFTNSKKLEGRPEFTEEWFKGLSDAEKSAAKEGARLQLDTQINNFRFAARKGMEIPEVEFNKQKLELLFGKEKTDKLIQALKDERAIANTHNKVIEGSQTAMRTASKSQFAMPNKTEVAKGMLPTAILEGANAVAGGYPLIPTLALATAKGGAMAKDAVKLALARNHNAQYAKYALPTEGPNRDALIKALEARIPGPKPSLLARGSNALSRIVAP